MNKSDFIDWKRHPITQVVFNQLASQVKELQELLGECAGRNPIQDVEFVGAIKAYKDILNMEYEGNEETQ